MTTALTDTSSPELLHSINPQNSIISYEYVDFLAKFFLILYPPLENSIKHIALLHIACALKSNVKGDLLPIKFYSVNTLYKQRNKFRLINTTLCTSHMYRMLCQSPCLYKQCSNIFIFSNSRS